MEKERLVIKRTDGKVILTLKGDFDNENIHWIKHQLENRRFFRCNSLQLDMTCATISSEALAQVITVLEMLKERGIRIEVTGLEKTHFNFSHTSEILAVTD